MKSQRVVASKAATGETRAIPAFRASTSLNQAPDRLSYKDLIRKLGTDFETSPTTWRRAVDHSAETVVFYQVDLRGDVPRMSKSVRIRREEGPGKSVSGMKYLVPTVYMGDMVLEYTYVMGIIGQRYLEDEDDLMKLLEHADLLYTADAAERDDGGMVDGSLREESEESGFAAGEKEKGTLDVVLKSPPKQRSSRISIRNHEGKTGKKRKNDSSGSNDGESNSVEKSGVAPVTRNTKTRNTRDQGAKMQQKHNASKEKSSVSDPDYSSPEPEVARSNTKRQKPKPLSSRSRSATGRLPRRTKSETHRPTPFASDVALLDSGNTTDESSTLPADDNDADDDVPLERVKKNKSSQSEGNASAMDEEEEQVSGHTSYAEDRYTCPHCKKRFVNPFNRERHMREIHEKLGRAKRPKGNKTVRERSMASHLSLQSMRHDIDDQRDASESF